MRDKRSRKRRNSPHRINVLRSTDGVILGRLVNITVGGLMYLGEVSRTEGEILDLRLPLPTVINGNNFIEMQGEVIWCRNDDNPRYHRIGVQFQNLGAEEGYVVETVLQRLHLVG